MKLAYKQFHLHLESNEFNEMILSFVQEKGTTPRRLVNRKAIADFFSTPVVFGLREYSNLRRSQGAVTVRDISYWIPKSSLNIVHLNFSWVDISDKLQQRFVKNAMFGFGFLRSLRIELFTMTNRFVWRLST